LEIVRFGEMPPRNLPNNYSLCCAVAVGPVTSFVQPTFGDRLQPAGAIDIQNRGGEACTFPFARLQRGCWPQNAVLGTAKSQCNLGNWLANGISVHYPIIILPNPFPAHGPEPPV
jgi:hypothetical protein